MWYWPGRLAPATHTLLEHPPCSMTNTIPRDCTRICQCNTSNSFDHLPERRGRDDRAGLQDCMWLRAPQPRHDRTYTLKIDFHELRSSC